MGKTTHAFGFKLERDPEFKHERNVECFVEEVMRDGRPLKSITARELQTMEFPPIKYIVEPYFVEGLTLFAGKPKIGKSWLALDVALAVAYGGAALGNIEVEAGNVLYAALEDNRRRLQRRISQLLMEDADWPEALDLVTDMRRLDDGGLDDITRWADKADNPRLVVIDTFAKVRPAKGSKDGTYDADYASLVPLQQFAGERGLGVILVHHQRKMDSEDPLDTVSGTTGLTGAADSVLVLARDTQGVVLHGRGRDIDEVEAAMQFDKTSGRWSVLGDASEMRRSEERTNILKVLREEDAPMGPRDIAKATALPEDSVRHLCRKMVQAGDLEKKGYGKYAAL